MLADSDTGYLCNFSIYLGRPDGGRREVDLCTKVVLAVSEPFHFTNRHLFFDNYFTSITLVEELLKRGTYACATLRTNRYPPTCKGKGAGKGKGKGKGKGSKSTTSLKLTQKGQLRQLQKGSILLTVWYDKRQVAVLSSNCNPNETVNVQRRTKEPPHIKDVSVPCPIHKYNQKMGGVDLGDQMRSYYPSGQ